MSPDHFFEAQVSCSTGHNATSSAHKHSCPNDHNSQPQQGRHLHPRDEPEPEAGPSHDLYRSSDTAIHHRVLPPPDSRLFIGSEEEDLERLRQEVESIGEGMRGFRNKLDRKNELELKEKWSLRGK